MKFMKGLMIGGLITTGLVMMYSDTGMIPSLRFQLMWTAICSAVF